MSVLANLVLFAVTALEYWMASYVCFSRKMKRPWILLGMSAVLLFILVLNSDMVRGDSYVIVYFSVLLSTLFMMEGKWNQRVENLLELFVLLCCMEQIWYTILKLVSLHTVLEYGVENGAAIVVAVGTILVLSVMNIVKGKKKGIVQKFGESVMAKLNYLVAVTTIVLYFTISGLNYIERYIPKRDFTESILCLCVMAYMCVGVLGGLAIYIRRVNYKMNEMLQRERLLNDMQQYYYETLLKKEEDTRRYRHDMANHIICLKGLVEDGDWERVKTYLNEMHGQISHIQRRNCETGNRTLDVITNYYLGMLEENVSVQVSGKMTGRISIENMSLCAIYANLLQNAVEELLKEGEEKYLKIQFLQGQEYIQISIQNTLSMESRQKEKLLVTQKTDKKNHGIGLRNVQEELEKFGGRLELIREDNCFIAQVVLPYE